MEEIILFAACLFSFAALVISLMFFLRFKKSFFLHVFLILFSFFLISTNSLFAILHEPISDRTQLCIFGAILSLCFSSGIISFAFDLTHVKPASALVFAYPLAVTAFAVVSVFVPEIANPGLILNVSGIWIPSLFSILFVLAFRKRVNTDIFRKEKWIFVILAVLNLAVSLVVHNAPFVFIIFVSVLVFHIFYRFYFSSPIAKTEQKLSEKFIRDFAVTKREQEIILLLLEGKSNKELSESLFISEKTIETHLANIYRKVGVKNRFELFSRLKNA